MQTNRPVSKSMMPGERLASAWIRDMPQQFQEKRNIGILIHALARQMEEVEMVFGEINTLTDIHTARGKNLDYVGDIVCMSRKEAGELINRRFPEPVISDERYREYLQYQVLRNTSDCTYADIMKAIDLLWDVDRARYYEREDRPATIFIGLPAVDIEEEDPAEGKPQILKPGGVGFVYTVQYGIRADHTVMERVIFSRLNLHVWFRFFDMRLLDGKWILDGSVHLGQRPGCQMKAAVICGMIPARYTEVMELSGILFFMKFPDVQMLHEFGVKIKTAVRSSAVWNMKAEKMRIWIPLPEYGTVKSDFVTIKKNLWQLDGLVMLDGSRLLDAEMRKERL